MNEPTLLPLMTDDERLDELITRVSAAKAPSRALDSAIAAHLGFEGWTPEQWAEVEADPKMVLPAIPKASCFTASLDAVKQHVPEGWCAAVVMGDKHRGHSAYCHNNQSAFLGVGSARNPPRIWFEVQAATPELAFCVAWLRALQHVRREAEVLGSAHS
jgi:hypothetical protein